MFVNNAKLEDGNRFNNKSFRCSSLSHFHGVFTSKKPCFWRLLFYDGFIVRPYDEFSFFKTNCHRKYLLTVYRLRRFSVTVYRRHNDKNDESCVFILIFSLVRRATCIVYRIGRYAASPSGVDDVRVCILNNPDHDVYTHLLS